MQQTPFDDNSLRMTQCYSSSAYFFVEIIFVSGFDYLFYVLLMYIFNEIVCYSNSKCSIKMFTVCSKQKNKIDSSHRYDGIAC